MENKSHAPNHQPVPNRGTTWWPHSLDDRCPRIREHQSSSWKEVHPDMRIRKTKTMGPLFFETNLAKHTGSGHCHNCALDPPSVSDLELELLGILVKRLRNDFCLRVSGRPCLQGHRKRLCPERSGTHPHAVQNSRVVSDWRFWRWSQTGGHPPIAVLSLYKFCKSLETHHIKDFKNIFTSESILGQELGPPAIDGSRSKWGI